LPKLQANCQFSGLTREGEEQLLDEPAPYVFLLIQLAVYKEI
jgi:hypothetical protein